MFDFSVITQWFDSLLRNTCGLGDFWTILIECVAVGAIILLLYTVFAIFMIFFERKVCAWFQCRLGPMRVGPWGTLQVIADVVKMLIKEIFAVDKADKLLYVLAPCLTIIASVGTFAFLPWNKGALVLDFNVGVFLITAISSIGILGIILAGWGSNNKYSVVSAMRGAVQMISYELSLALCLITAVVLVGSMQLSDIINAQTGPWQWLVIQGHIPRPARGRGRQSPASPAFPHRPVKIDIAGTIESIAQITPELLYRCYHTFYNLHNMVLSVAGNAR